MKKTKIFIPIAAIILYITSVINGSAHAQGKNVEEINTDELEITIIKDDEIILKENLQLLADKLIVLADEIDNEIELEDSDFDIDFDDVDIEMFSTETYKNKGSKKRFKFNLFSMDVGINGFVDNTNYSSADAANFVRVSADNRNEKAFDIKNGQSRNINLWPASFNFDLSAHPDQNVYLSLGVPGFQFYSLKYNNPIRFVEGIDPHVIETNETYSKNKLGITYLSIPVSITGQTRISKSKWVTYGAGIIGGYRIASWTNQKAKGEEKIKIKDPFNLNDYQVALTGEIGVKGILRLYGTYNLTNMWDSALDQNLFAVGIRFFGI